MTHQSFIEYFNREDQLVLEEGLIKTYPAEAFEHALKTKFKDCTEQLFVDKNFLGFKTKFELHLKDTSKLKEIESFVDTIAGLSGDETEWEIRYLMGFIIYIEIEI